MARRHGRERDYVIWPLSAAVAVANIRSEIITHYRRLPQDDVDTPSRCRPAEYVAGPERMNTHVSPLSAAAGSHWSASLELRFSRTGSGTRLAHCRHDGPLYV